MKSGAIDWSAVPLGEMPDTCIAELLGCTPQAVYFARRARGVAPFSRKSVPLGATAREAALRIMDGAHHDHEIARSVGGSPQQIAHLRRRAGAKRKRRDWNALAAELGKAPDSVIAHRHGVDNKVVAQARWDRGIPKWEESRSCPCGTAFIAFRFDQRFCGSRCQRSHWDLVHNHGMPSAAADCALALAAYRRTLKRRALHVEEQSRLAGVDSRRSSAAEE